jgi:hypothetical protein
MVGNMACASWFMKKNWSAPEVKEYFSIMCINDATYNNFILCCGNYEWMDLDRWKIVIVNWILPHPL